MCVRLWSDKGKERLSTSGQNLFYETVTNEVEELLSHKIVIFHIEAQRLKRVFVNRSFAQIVAWWLYEDLLNNNEMMRKKQQKKSNESSLFD